MRRLVNNLRSRQQLCVLLAIAFVVAAIPLISCAQTQTPKITITNNSSLEIKHLYLSPVDSEDWGPDQLNGSVINAGQSYTLNIATCTDSSIKLISEDQNGCFLRHTVACSGDAAWTISNSDAPDCGN
jgi:hypothetical protein